MEFVQNFLDLERWVSFFNALVLPITALSDFFTNDVPLFVSWINPTNFLPNLISAISSGFSALGTEIYDGVTDLLGGISTMLEGMTSFFVGVWESIVNFFSDIFDGGDFTWGGGGFSGGGGGAR